MASSRPPIGYCPVTEQTGYSRQRAMPSLMCDSTAVPAPVPLSKRRTQTDCRTPRRTTILAEPKMHRNECKKVSFPCIGVDTNESVTFSRRPCIRRVRCGKLHGSNEKRFPFAPRVGLEFTESNSTRWGAVRNSPLQHAQFRRTTNGNPEVLHKATLCDDAEPLADSAKCADSKIDVR